MNIIEIEDRIALKELIDQISFLGDDKDFQGHVLLFSEDAISETIAEGKTILKLEGRREMSKAFENFLQNFETVYHFNGQHVVKIEGDNARGKYYCLITFIGSNDGNKIKTTIGANYEDEYIRSDGRWLVSKRTGNFVWQDKTEIIKSI